MLPCVARGAPLPPGDRQRQPGQSLRAALQGYRQSGVVPALTRLDSISICEMDLKAASLFETHVDPCVLHRNPYWYNNAMRVRLVHAGQCATSRPVDLCLHARGPGATYPVAR